MKTVKATKPKKDESFRDYVLDALSSLNGVRSRSMFGGYGLYLEGIFFGLIAEGALYFRVDDASRPEYAGRGSQPFTYSRDGKSVTMAYYEVPSDVLEDHEMLASWARRAADAYRNKKK